MKHVFARRVSLLALGVVVGLCLDRPAEAQQAPSERTADRQQISAILTRWENAWNTHDMAAFAALFHEDGVWVLWTGAVWTGRQAIQEGHAEAHKTIFRNSTQRERLEELTFVGPDAAVARFCSTLTGDERQPDKLVHVVIRSWS